MCDDNVKPEDRTLWQRVCHWVDSRPRLGWAIAVWLFIISTESLIGYIDFALRLLS